MIAGKGEQLIGQIREQYGIGEDEAETPVDRFAGSFSGENFKR